MTDIVTRLKDYAAEVKSRIDRGVVPFCHLGASVVGPMAKEAADRIEQLEAENARLREAMRGIYPYLEWTISDESPAQHPTMPSAVAAFKEVMGPSDYEIRLASKALETP